MKAVIELAKNKDCKAKIMVGGAPLTQSYANEIGAHGFAPDAATAVEIATEIRLSRFIFIVECVKRGGAIPSFFTARRFRAPSAGSAICRPG